MANYETALRACLLDFQAMSESVLAGRYRHEHTGQLRALVRDAKLLRNREDCPAYDYKKEGK